MNSIILTDEEIETINSLIEEVATIPVIECIYAKPIIRDYDEKPSLAIRILLSDNIEYNDLIKKEFSVRDIKMEIQDFNNLSRKYDQYFQRINNGRCVLQIEWSNNYVPWFTVYEEMLAAEELVNGVILYDRYGSMTFNQEHVGAAIDKDPKLPVIENIDCINKKIKK